MYANPAGQQLYPGRSRAKQAQKVIGGYLVEFEHGYWEEQTAQDAVEFLKGNRSYNWQTKKMVICQKPFGDKSAYHKGGRPGDLNADPDNHATVRCYAEEDATKDTYLWTFHVRDDGYGTGYAPTPSINQGTNAGQWGAGNRAGYNGRAPTPSVNRVTNAGQWGAGNRAGYNGRTPPTPSVNRGTNAGQWGGGNRAGYSGLAPPTPSVNRGTNGGQWGLGNRTGYGGVAAPTPSVNRGTNAGQWGAGNRTGYGGATPGSALPMTREESIHHRKRVQRNWRTGESAIPENPGQGGEN